MAHDLFFTSLMVTELFLICAPVISVAAVAVHVHATRSATQAMTVPGEVRRRANLLESPW
jgi:hypothetical protein